MATTKLATALERYMAAYAAGDLDALMANFTDDPVVIWLGSMKCVGHEEVAKSHAMIGKFRYHVDRVFDAGDSFQVFEGAMYAVKDGEEVKDAPVPYAGIAELKSNGTKIQEMRVYYDGGKTRAAMVAAGLVHP